MGTYRPATASERRRYGVSHRLTGSKWYKSSHAACVYPKLTSVSWRDEARARKAQHTRALGAPQRFALTGDGAHACKLIADALNKSDDELRVALCEARYRDWLAQREAVAAEPAPASPKRERQRSRRRSAIDHAAPAIDRAYAAWVQKATIDCAYATWVQEAAP